MGGMNVGGAGKAHGPQRPQGADKAGAKTDVKAKKTFGQKVMTFNPLKGLKSLAKGIANRLGKREKGGGKETTEAFLAEIFDAPLTSDEKAAAKEHEQMFGGKKNASEGQYDVLPQLREKVPERSQYGGAPQKKEKAPEKSQYGVAPQKKEKAASQYQEIPKGLSPRLDSDSSPYGSLPVTENARPKEGQYASLSGKDLKPEADKGKLQRTETKYGELKSDDELAKKESSKVSNDPPRPTRAPPQIGNVPPKPTRPIGPPPSKGKLERTETKYGELKSDSKLLNEEADELLKGLAEDAKDYEKTSPSKPPQKPPPPTPDTKPGWKGTAGPSIYRTIPKQKPPSDDTNT